jgi:pimeloyl-ACP methyl ester carboxylesterase
MTLLRDPRFEGSVPLADRRQLGFAEFGAAGGRPLLWFHGTPGARRQIAPAARQLAEEQDIRLVCVERPGIGHSTPHSYRAIVDFAADIEQLLDSLGIDRYGVVGLSGGGPYALACAHQMPERVVAATILGGVAPTVGKDAATGGANGLIRMSAPALDFAKGAVGAFMRRFVFAMQPVGDRMIDLFAAAMPPGDKRVFADPAVRQMFMEDIVLGSRTHMQAAWHDVVLFGKDWGFELREIQVPVTLRYGDSDNIVPADHGEHLAERIPGSVLHILHEEGHLGGLGSSAEIFESIFRHWERRAPAALEEPRSR